VFRDDPGHRQPSIAVDGDGYIHVFTALHKNHWVYYRSGRPRDVHTMVNRSAQLPDQGDVYTYPVLTRTGQGDVYMVIRAATGGGPEHGRLYRWANPTNAWSRVAIFASQVGYTVYPGHTK